MTRSRFIFHLCEREQDSWPYAPASLAREGFVHGSFKDAVGDTARVHFGGRRDLHLLCLDPRRLGARLELAATPRGPMPHVHGPIPKDAVRWSGPLDELDALVIPGGPGARARVDDASLVAWLRTFPSNRLVVSVCTGALLVGAMGRLAGRRATTHASALERLPAFGATVSRERVVDDGDVITAGGVTSGLDAGLHVVRSLMGDDVAARVAAQMEWR